MSDTNLSVLDRAIIFAVKAHSGMTRKGKNAPYILHPLESASIVASMTDDENVIAAAVLHDVLEDTPVTPEQLEKEFGRAAQIVAGETENKREGQPATDTWKVRKQETIEHLKNISSREEKMVTLGDKLSNMREIRRDYEELGEKFWDRFNQKDKNEHAWYHQSVADALSELKEYAAWREYAELIKRVFG